MKRIDVLYDSSHYSIGGDDYDTIKAAITAAAMGEATWITVNHGEGRAQPAELLIGPGIPIALLPVGPDDDQSDATTNTSE